MMGRGALAAAVAVFAAGRGASASCAFRFEGHLNISELPTWTVPATEASGSGYRVLNDEYPLVFLVSEELEQTAAVTNCTGTSWRYLLSDGSTYTDELSFPNADSHDDTSKVTFEGLFNASMENLVVDSIPANKAVAVSDSLYGRTVEVVLSCEIEDDEEVDDAESCVMFEVNFTNTSPVPEGTAALYRFTDPALAQVVLPPSGNFSPGDIQLNMNNSIVMLDGSEILHGCNGDVANYLGEDGEWYFWFTGSNGDLFNLTHVFYATEQDHLNIATIQRNWSPNMEAALYSRLVKLEIYCNNIEEREYGYIFFTVGNEEDSFGLTCDEVPCLCEVEGDNCDRSGAQRRAGMGSQGVQQWVVAMCTLVAMGAVSTFMSKSPS